MFHHNILILCVTPTSGLSPTQMQGVRPILTNLMPIIGSIWLNPDEWLTPTERAVRLQRRTLINNRCRARLHQQAIQHRHQAPLPGGNNGGHAPPVPVQPPIPLLPVNQPPIPHVQPVHNQPQEAPNVQDNRNEVANDPSEAIEAGDHDNVDDDLSVPEGVAEDENIQQEEQPNVPTEVPILKQATEDVKQEEDETLNQTLQNLQEQAIRIGQYLKSSVNEGLILRPTDSFDIECHVDADFAGLYSVEDVMDPTCVKSRTGYVISVCGCPVVWVSRLQTDIATATMEAEYNALSMAMRDILPLQRVFKTIQ
ncbi:unnamed protein product [Cylindrotheca closterium]|uniref:Uncharacterized protein n=1 Tax=Cylindrotheca closterium TaxID=2856 RepID=A0AAD2JPI2_9STRA|nr:unnamed protein product [Cylindrotheca closterium]